MDKLLCSLRGHVDIMIYKKSKQYNDYKINTKIIDRKSYIFKNDYDVEKMLKVLGEYDKCCFLILTRKVIIDTSLLNEILMIDNIDMCLIKDESYIIFRDTDNIDINTNNDNICLLLTDSGLQKVLNNTPDSLSVIYYFAPIIIFILLLYLIKKKEKENTESKLQIKTEQL